MRLLQQTESKDLRLGFDELQIHHIEQDQLFWLATDC